ncbi:major facilitator superfamily MFS_1 [Candidatus Protofrankia datiscae]|uniref:Major facilitator superfamily MFS_1 n=1 Tax=Candidatus Protofrankia datiscae TaxID=2716812 RepID=F8B0T5_9ACTN|nr:MFS transporter [Candidatus Protofrankia datiscae]AEH11781.1 major facilitator superfamily MFS_1 [Candidatus Protofrankia datiscae]
MARAGDLRQLLGLTGFRRLYAARLTSQAADGVFQASLVSYVLFSPERATSATALAASLAIVVLPFSVIGPFAGIVLDRISRQRVLVLCALARAVLLVLLVLLIAAGHNGVDFYTSALAVFSVNRLVLAALSAGLPVVVPTGRLVTANALSVTSGTVMTLVGAGIGSGIRGLIGGDDAGVALVAALAAVVYLAAAGTAGRAGRYEFGPLHSPPGQGLLREARQVVVELAAGAGHLWRRRPARYALATLTGSRAAYGLTTVMAILLYRNYFTGADGGLGGLALLVTASGAGTVAAALVTPRVTRLVSKQVWISLVLLAAGIIEIALCLPFSSPLLIAGSVPIGFATQASKICVDTIVQEQTEDAYRGRAFSLYDLLFNVAYVAAAALAAITLPPTGRSPVMVLAAGGGFIVCALLYLRARGPQTPAPDPTVTAARRLPAATATADPTTAGQPHRCADAPA